MGFLFPFFLISGLALAIPLIIHLFNLRKYKRVDFPDTRFLRDIQLSTKRQATIRNKTLMIVRMLFLAALVLAFAQPFFYQEKNGGKEDRVIALYIDNSYSMTLGAGQQSLLQKAVGKAKDLVKKSSANSRFLVLTNDRPAATRPMIQDEALKALSVIHPTAKPASLRKIMQSVATAQGNERGTAWSIYLFSDMQQGAFIGREQIAGLKNATVYFYPMQEKGAGNIYIDTAYFLTPNLDTRQPNDLVVVVKESGETGDGAINVNVSVDGQVRAVSSVVPDHDTIMSDTVALQLSTTGWQPIIISLQDHPLSFDDTFRIAARTSPELSVLVIGDGPLSPYLQAAFRTNEGFKVQQQNTLVANTGEWKKYNLIILQNISLITPSLELAVKEALAGGQNILLFPAANSNIALLNQSLKKWGDISFDETDTSRQQVISIQQAHPLLQDVFEKIPENVQLPVTTKRYLINAGLTANQQALMSFRDGRPFLAQYTLDQGKLYICAAPLDDRSSNFAVSYFFVPVLYKMAVQSGGNSIYALPVGGSGPLWLPAGSNDSRSVWKMTAAGFDAIPPQRPAGSGSEIFAGNVAPVAGFYNLQHEGADTVLVASNSNGIESRLDFADKRQVEDIFAPMKVNWLDEHSIGRDGWARAEAPFPLWKIAIMLGLLLLAIETWLLWKGNSKNYNEPAMVN